MSTLLRPEKSVLVKTKRCPKGRLLLNPSRSLSRRLRRLHRYLLAIRIRRRLSYLSLISMPVMISAFPHRCRVMLPFTRLRKSVTMDAIVAATMRRLTKFRTTFPITLHRTICICIPVLNLLLMSSLHYGISPIMRHPSLELPKNPTKASPHLSLITASSPIQSTLLMMSSCLGLPMRRFTLHCGTDSSGQPARTSPVGVARQRQFQSPVP